MPERLIWLLQSTPLHALTAAACGSGLVDDPAACLQSALETAPASSRAGMHQCCSLDVSCVVTCSNWRDNDPRSGRLRCNKKTGPGHLTPHAASAFCCDIVTVAAPTATPWSLPAALTHCLYAVATKARGVCRSCCNQALHTRTFGQPAPDAAAVRRLATPATVAGVKVSRVPELLPVTVRLDSSAALQYLVVPLTLNYGSDLRAVMHKDLLQTKVHGKEDTMVAPFVGFLLSGTGWSVDARRVFEAPSVTLHTRIVGQPSPPASSPDTQRGNVWTCDILCPQDATSGSINVGALLSTIAKTCPALAETATAAISAESGGISCMLLFGSQVRLAPVPGLHRVAS